MGNKKSTLTLALLDLCHVMAKYLSPSRLWIGQVFFPSDAAVALPRGRRLLSPAACSAPCFPSVHLCVGACVCGSQLRSPYLRQTTAFVRILFCPPLCWVDVCFYSYRILIPEQHLSRVFATVPGGGWKEMIRSSFWRPFVCRFVGMCLFFTLGGNLKFVLRLRTQKKKGRKWCDCASCQHLSFINAEDYSDLPKCLSSAGQRWITHSHATKLLEFVAGVDDVISCLGCRANRLSVFPLLGKKRTQKCHLT